MPFIGAIDLFPRVEKCADIPLLPWKGNASSDMTLIQLVDDYIRRETTRIPQKKEAIRLLDIHAFGLNDPGEIYDVELKFYLDDLSDADSLIII